MSTKLYFQSTASSPITPAVSSSWDYSISAFARYPTSITKASQAMTFISLDGNGDASDNDYCFGQWISGALAAQTIGGTDVYVKIQMRCMEEAARVNAFLTATVRILSGDGTTVRGTVCALTRDNTEMVATTNEALATNRAWAISSTTAVSAQEGDRIVIEVGSGGDPSSGSGGNSHDSDICVGDASSTDLTIDDDMEVANNNPYCLFEDDITWYVAGTDDEDERDCRTHGSDDDSSERDVRTHGLNVDESERACRTKGSSSEPTVIDSYKAGAQAYLIYAGEEMRAQSFEVEHPHVLVSAMFKIKKQGSPLGNMYAEIWTHTGTYGSSSKPGVLLATSDPKEIADLTLSTVETEFTFSDDDCIQLDGIENYCSIIKYDAGNISNCLVALVDSASPTHAGNAATYSGTTWTEAAGTDMYFSVTGQWGTAADDTRDCRTIGGISDESERDVRTYGVASDESERDARTHGVASDVTERDVRTIGDSSEDSERDVRTQGSDVDSDERDARTHGSDWDESERGCRTEGSSVGTQDEDERDARTWGGSSGDSERDARTYGIASDDDERGVRTIGDSSEESERDGRTHGVQTGDDERDARTIGDSSDESERDVRTHGIFSDDSERDGRTQGSDVDEDERDARTHGSDADESERSCRTEGSSTGTQDDDERDCRTWGISSDDDERDVRTHGNCSIWDIRYCHTHGCDSLSSERDSRTWGVSSEDSERGVRTQGSQVGSTQRTCRTWGSIPDDSERGCRTHGIDVSSSERSCRTHGSNSIYEIRYCRTHGVNSDSSERGCRTEGLYEGIAASYAIVTIAPTQTAENRQPEIATEVQTVYVNIRIRQDAMSVRLEIQKVKARMLKEA